MVAKEPLILLAPVEKQEPFNKEVQKINDSKYHFLHNLTQDPSSVEKMPTIVLEADFFEKTLVPVVNKSLDWIAKST